MTKKEKFNRFFIINILFFSAHAFYYTITIKGNYYFINSDNFSNVNFLISFLVLNYFIKFFFLSNDFVNKIFAIPFVMMIVPSFTIFSFLGGLIFFLLNILIFSFAFFLTKNLNINYSKILKVKDYDKKKFVNLSLILGLIISINLIYLIIISDVKQITFDIDYFSDNRAFLNLSSFDIYFFSISTTTLLPILMVLLLKLKIYIIVLFTILLFFFYGLFLSVKIIFFIPFIILICFYFEKYKFVDLVLVFTSLILIISIIDIISVYNLGYGYKYSHFGNYLGRRLIFIPSIVNYAYFTEFSNSFFIYWQESKLTLNTLKPSHDEANIAKYIGAKYFTRDYSVNSGWFGSGFANHGLVGLIIYTLIISTYLNFFNSFKKILDQNILISFVIVSLFYFMSSDIITSFITYGFILIPLFILFLILKPSYKA